MDNREVVSTLNDLIETCKDGEQGFQECAADVHDEQIKRIFADRAQECAVAANELQELVRAHGGVPGTRGSVSAALHRRWVDIKSAIGRHGDDAVLSECERGEDVALHSYENALQKDLPPDVRTVVERQHMGVVRNYEQVKSLHNQVRSQQH